MATRNDRHLYRYLANSWEEVADDDYLRWALLVIFLTTTLTVLAWNKRSYYLEPNNDNPNGRASDLAHARKSLRSPDNATIRDVADLSDINALADAKGYVTTRESSTHH